MHTHRDLKGNVSVNMTHFTHLYLLHISYRVLSLWSRELPGLIQIYIQGFLKEYIWCKSFLSQLKDDTIYPTSESV